MSDCISLVDTLIPIDDLSKWVLTSHMRNVIHTEEIEILSVASGYLEIEPFCVPDLDCRIVGSIIYHSCDNNGLIHSFTCETIPHIFQHGCDTCIKLDCWSLDSKEQIDAPVYEWNPNPCARLLELRSCQMEWLKAGKKTSWSFRDSSGSKTYLSERCLKDLIAEAESQCDELINGGSSGSRCLTFGCGRANN